ncbi:hypothetical protein B9Z19DRAFT_1130898 [Tuber borchii]|uniref:Uncharacterized protein n=1 Tax=Tuber borchii TaxID=42251 RepID=A0A2T6ZJI0_TUBBO|nr:hypothetical protein B9Z19DRAFT_1130898 [Tuber borchii]
MREMWTRDRWNRGSVDQDRRLRVRGKRLDLGTGWWTKTFKGTRGQDVPMVALPPGIPPPGRGDGGNGGNGGNA